jgi:hypothetical protein
LSFQHAPDESLAARAKRGTVGRMPSPAKNVAPSADHAPLSLQELEALPADSPELDRRLPQWVVEAHRRYLETGEGDPWGGYFT